MSVGDFLREADRLRKLVSKHEREKNRRNDVRECFCVFEDFDNKLKVELRGEVMRVKEQLQKIRNCVSRLQRQLTDVKPSQDLIDKLNDTMTDIENSINIFKYTQHQSFEKLLKEERIFWQEICAFEKKIDVWTLSVRTDSQTVCAPSAKRCSEQKGTRNLPPEVMAVEMFLQQRGGPQGGWDQYDHQSFMTVWTKHNGKPSYRKEAKLYLPSKTEEDIKLHEEWYLELCHLQEKKKEAIHKWRAAKQKERQEQLQEGDERMSELESTTAAAQRLKQEQQRREAAERLEDWKRARKQLQEQEEEQILRNEVLQRKQAKEERRRQLEVKLNVEAYVEQKKKEKELQLLEKEVQQQVEREERQRLAVEGIRRFQERDLHSLKAKLQEKQTKEEEEFERQRNLAKLKQKVEVHISRDPSRLWKPTKGWEARTKEIGPSGAGPVSQMFHRAVPTWRQEL